MQLTGEEGIHHPSNVLTMAQPLRSLFDTLHLWLEPTDTVHEVSDRHRTPPLANIHQYNICTSDAALLALYRIPSFTVQLHDHSGAALPLPDPALLALHAACAKTAHMSGAAEFFDALDWEDEDSAVLASDGASYGLLFEKLQSLEVLGSAVPGGTSR